MFVYGVGYDHIHKLASQLVVATVVIAFIGLGSIIGGLDVRRMTLPKINFIGTYTYTAQDLYYTARTIFTDALGPLDCTEQRPPQDRQKAFSDIRASPVASQKTILSP